MIDVKHLSKSFGANLVLDDISEHIYPGEKVVVLGPSGSGKSTFLRCLNLLETPTKGTITFQGTEITDPKADINKIRQQMGMVFQHFNLFPNMTIRKNITLAPVRTGLMKQEEADDTAAALAGIAKQESFFRSIGMPVRLGELSCGVQDEAGLADLASRCSFGKTRTIGTFRVLDYEKILAIYRRANEA